MPPPLSTSRRYMPGLDGLRALAVAAVIAYHLNLSWAPGGLLGVGVFFTLSGYLITDLLLAAKAANRLSLRNFWLGRARRLLPALFAMLIVIGIWVWLDDHAQLAVVRGQTLAALVYMSNWWQSFQHLSYFARFGPPSPLDHLWSLAVEEQFYLLWPWLLLLGVHVIRERRPGARRPRLAAIILVLAGASALEMALLFHPSFDPSRIYYGTDTRAFGLLLGAALACVWPSRALRSQVGRHAPAILDAFGVLGLVGIGVLVWRTSQYSPFLYEGGMVLLSVCTVAVIAAVTHPSARLGTALGVLPLRWLGERSYGIYLWQTPVIALTASRSATGVQPVRAVLQVAGTIVIAAISWRFLENPIRHGALGRTWARARAAGWRPREVPASTRWGVGSLALAVILVAVAISGAVAPPFNGPVIATAEVGPTGPPTSTEAPAGGSKRSPGGTAHAGVGGAGTLSPSQTRSVGMAHAGTDRQKGSPRTSCRSVVHIGDSTSEGMISNDYLPDPGQQLPEQYARVGVRHSTMEITGGTSIIETLPGDTDAGAVAQNLVSGAYRGCWVIALGTNDAADVYVGSSISLAQRIRKMMAVIGHQPVLWVDAKTLVSSGPYAESNMRKWNQALAAACTRYPSMRVYDWAAAARDKWFIPDGIHYTSAGYAARSYLIADALAEAFPSAGGPSASCSVVTPPVNVPLLGVH